MENEYYKKVYEFIDVEVSNYGNVRYISTGKLLKKTTSKNAINVYIVEGGRPKCRTVSQLIAFHFVENPFNYNYVLPKDGNIHNCNALNLKWVADTRSARVSLSGYKRKTKKTLVDHAFINEMLIKEQQIADKLNPFKTKKQ